MKIAIIGTVASSIIGFRRDFIIRLVSEGHQVFAFAVDYTEESALEVSSLGAVPVAYSFNRTGMNPVLDIIDMFRLSRKLAGVAPDIVFSYFVKPVIFGTFAAKLAGVKQCIAMLEGLGYIFTEQPEGISFKVRLLRLVQVSLYRISLPLLNKLIFLNHDDPIDLLVRYRINVRQVEVLGGIGLDLSLYPYVKPDVNELAFIFVGRLLKEKGIREFIEAAKIVMNSGSRVRCVVLGGLDECNPGGLKEAEVDELVRSGVIEYHGHVSDVSQWIAKCSVFVLPSYREGLPRSTQEAMAIGRAVITTDVPGCRETVIDGVNGFIVPPWQPKALAQKMLFFINNPKQIEVMGLASYELAQAKYDAAKVNERLIELVGL